jgi:hypothetical protein
MRYTVVFDLVKFFRLTYGTSTVWPRANCAPRSKNVHSLLRGLFDGLAHKPLQSTECRAVCRPAAGAGSWRWCWLP